MKIWLLAGALTLVAASYGQGAADIGADHCDALAAGRLKSS
jgi:hypothetical protein